MNEVEGVLWIEKKNSPNLNISERGLYLTPKTLTLKMLSGH